METIAQLTPHALLGISAFILGLVLTIIVPFKQNQRDYLSKLIGSSFTISLALIANNWFVFCIAIFVIATLVTELKFLEKMMALLWGRPEYWDYLIKTATKEEVKEEIKKQAKEENIPAKSIPTYITKTITFEERVLNLLIEPHLGLFPNSKMIKDPQLSQDETKLMIDALVYDKDIIYLIETKAAKDKAILEKTLETVKSFEVAFKEQNLKANSKEVTTKMLLIVPNKMISGNQINHIPVLKVADDLTKFTNLKAIQKMLQQN